MMPSLHDHQPYDQYDQDDQYEGYGQGGPGGGRGAPGGRYGGYYTPQSNFYRKRNTNYHPQHRGNPRIEEARKEGGFYHDTYTPKEGRRGYNRGGGGFSGFMKETMKTMRPEPPRNMHGGPGPGPGGPPPVRGMPHPERENRRRMMPGPPPPHHRDKYNDYGIYECEDEDSSEDMERGANEIY